MKKELEAREFSYTVRHADETFDVRSAVVVGPNWYKTAWGPMDATIYAEDEDGDVIDFTTVAEAQAWIDKYKDRIELHFEHGDELHATPKRI